MNFVSNWPGHLFAFLIIHIFIVQLPSSSLAHPHTNRLPTLGEILFLKHVSKNKSSRDSFQFQFSRNNESDEKIARDERRRKFFLLIFPFKKKFSPQRKIRNIFITNKEINFLIKLNLHKKDFPDENSSEASKIFSTISSRKVKNREREKKI